jgi:hypothetical protein
MPHTFYIIVIVLLCVLLAGWVGAAIYAFKALNHYKKKFKWTDIDMQNCWHHAREGTVRASRSYDTYEQWRNEQDIIEGRIAIHDGF